jgi:hypothetical protein
MHHFTTNWGSAQIAKITLFFIASTFLKYKKAVENVFFVKLNWKRGMKKMGRPKNNNRVIMMKVELPEETARTFKALCVLEGVPMQRKVGQMINTWIRIKRKEAEN